MQHTAAAPRRGLHVLRLLGLLVVTMLLVHHARRPPEPRAVSAPATEFAALRAMRHLGVIAQRPHPIGSADAARVRAYLLAALDSLGVTTEVQEVTAVGTRYQQLGHVRNIVGRLAGTSPGGPAILLMSHYDGVPAGPAASDAGSGVSVILELLRALRAGPPLARDVIVLFSDGEEAGLLGASAFVREHRWAKDVAVSLNFEARGTGGRASMFETGPGNLDLVRLLADTPDVTASSLIVTIYRTLNNDTDLSEVSRLDKPALNFAFVDGVERYHTTEDDTLHIDPGSMQQEGTQGLSIVRALGAGALPRPVTGDAVFTDVMPFGVLYYDEALVRPIALIGIVLFVLAMVLLHKRETQWLRDSLVGVVMTVAAVAVSGGLVFGASAIVSRVHDAVGGNPAFATAYAIAMTAQAVAGTLACWSLARRWCSVDGLHHGVLLVFTLLAALLSFKLPGASFLLVWPLLPALLASLLQPAGRVISGVATALATYVALAILVPMIATGPVLLGTIGQPGVMTAVQTVLLVCLIAPQLEAMLPERSGRIAIAFGGIGVLAMMIGAITVRVNAAHPVPSLLAYMVDADSGDAWLVAPSSTAKSGSWTAGVLGATMRVGEPGARTDSSSMPEWLAVASPFGSRLAGRQVARAAVPGPSATLVRDTVTPAGRELTLRIISPSGALGTELSVMRQRVRTAAVDGRVIDTTRFRRPQTEWDFTFSAPPDSGFTVTLTLTPGKSAVVDVSSRVAGLPVMTGVPVPPRTPGTLAMQTGDITVVRRRLEF